MINNIKVSVIVPNYNHSRYLRQRIESILNQTFTDFELILLDDSSSDNSQEILLSYQNNSHVTHIKINPQNSGSPFAQWEKGILLAKGEYIWIAESDDCAESNFLSATVKQLDEHPEARLCLTGSYIIDENNNFIQTTEFDNWEEDKKAYSFQSLNYLSTHMIHTNSVYNASMVLFRRNNCLLNITKRYKEMRYCGDWLFWIEQIRKGEVVEIHQKLNYFRKHRDNTTNKGTSEGNSVGEMAFIKNLLYTIVKDWRITLLDKYKFYQCVKKMSVSSAQRKKELLDLLAKEGNTTYWHYRIGKLYNSYLKHF